MDKNLSKHLLVVMLNVDPEVEEEFNEWYNTEHIPALIKVEGAISGQRYVSEDGPLKYMAIYEVDHPGVVRILGSRRNIFRSGPGQEGRRSRSHRGSQVRIATS